LGALTATTGALTVVFPGVLVVAAPTVVFPGVIVVFAAPLEGAVVVTGAPLATPVLLVAGSVPVDTGNLLGVEAPFVVDDPLAAGVDDPLAAGVDDPLAAEAGVGKGEVLVCDAGAFAVEADFADAWVGVADGLGLACCPELPAAAVFWPAAVAAITIASAKT
jgi:hypothetical protein